MTKSYNIMYILFLNINYLINATSFNLIRSDKYLPAYLAPTIYLNVI